MNSLHLPSLMAMAIASLAVSSCNTAPSASPSGALPSPSVPASPSPQVVTLPADAGAVAITPAPSPVSPSPTSDPASTVPLVVSPPTTDCAVKMAIVADPESPLNVRSSPDSQGNNVVGQLQNNAFVTITGEQEGWFQIDTPLTGWIVKNRTEYTCAFVDETIDLSPNQNQALVKGKIIGGGTHQYRLKLTQGQTLKIDNELQVFPRVLDPNAQSLNEDIASTEIKKWSTTISSSGEYILQLDSNFRGFSYEFLVTVN